MVGVREHLCKGSDHRFSFPDLVKLCFFVKLVDNDTLGAAFLNPVAGEDVNNKRLLIVFLPCFELLEKLILQIHDVFVAWILYYLVHIVRSEVQITVLLEGVLK